MLPKEFVEQNKKYLKILIFKDYYYFYSYSGGYILEWS